MEEERGGMCKHDVTIVVRMYRTIILNKYKFHTAVNVKKN